MEMLIGMFTGAAFGLVFAIFLIYKTKTDHSLKCKYDERQKEVLGVGYKYAFYFCIVYYMIYGLLSETMLLKQINTFCGCFLGVCIAVCIFSCYAIWHDAYFALNDNPKKVLIVFGVITLMNIISVIAAYCENNLMCEGKFTNSLVNIFAAGVFIVIYIAMIIRRLYLNNED